MTADERLDALLAEQAAEKEKENMQPKTPQRARSLEPSARMTPSLKSTRQSLTAKAAAEGPPPTVALAASGSGAPAQGGAAQGGLLSALMPPPNIGPLLAGMGTTSGLPALQPQVQGSLPVAWPGQGIPPLPGFSGVSELGAWEQLPILPERREVHGDLPGGLGQRPAGGGPHDILPEQAAQVLREESRQVSPVNPWSAEKMKAQGESGHENREDPVEALRRQCLQEAEQQFLVGLQKMHNPEQAVSNSSYNSAPEIPGGGVGAGGKPPFPWPGLAMVETLKE